MVIDVSLVLYLGLLGAVTVERIVELLLSKRNARIAFARGAVEFGLPHYRVMTAFHTAFLLACAAEPLILQREFPGVLGWISLAVVIAAQSLRYWAISTLGDRWNTRVIVEPGVAPVTGGPYRFLKHPNYVAVVLEMLALPLIHGGFLTAVVFSLGNAALLIVRIQVEEQALGDKWSAAFAGKPRFIPVGSREQGGPRD